MKKNKAFDLEHQYQLYLERVGLREDMMHPVQKKQLKEAFIGACGQMLVMLRDDLSKLDERDAIVEMSEMMNQVGRFFMKASDRTN